MELGSTHRTTLWLLGPTALAPGIRRAAERQAVDLFTVPEGPGVLRSRDPAGGGRTVPIPSGTELARELTGRVLDALTAALDRSPTHIEALIVRPARGVCGSAAAGPVDAVRFSGTWATETAVGSTFVRLVDVQQTRCWVANCALEADGGIAPSVRATGSVLPLGAAVAGDTAVLTQYMHDRGAGSDWPQVLVAGPPERGPRGRLRLVLAFTERLLVDDLVRQAMTAGGGDS